MVESRKIWLAVGIAAAGFFAWYFSDVLVYVIIAAVVALIGRPVKQLLCSIKFSRFKFPDWLAAAIALVLVLSVFLAVFFLLAPLITQISMRFGSIDVTRISEPLAVVNDWLAQNFASIGDDFKLESFAVSKLQELVKLNTVSSVLSSVTGFIADMAITLFSVAFISFFLLKEEGMLTRIILAVFPDKYEKKISRATESIKNLLSRYFVGIVIESLCIALLNSLFLIFIAGMQTEIAIVIASLTGIMNVVPYLGPLAGELLAGLMGLVTHYSSSFDGPMGVYIVVIVACCLVTQLIDNYLFQPVIYSNSVKAHPLEIFIVILMAAQVWGVVGMLFAVPGYTILRVVASEFLSQYKFVQKLTARMK